MEWRDEARYFSYVQAISTPHVTEQKIRGFGSLKAGWHYGEGVPFDESTIKRAITLLRRAIDRAFFETDAFPGLAGQVVVTIYASNHYVEFTVNTDGFSVSLCHEVDDEEVLYEESLTDDAAARFLDGLRKDIWKRSGSSALFSMTESWAGSKVPPSRTLVAGGSPLLIGNAYSNRALAPVATSGDIIRVLPTNPRFSGSSPQRCFQIAAG